MLIDCRLLRCLSHIAQIVIGGYVLIVGSDICFAKGKVGGTATIEELVVLEKKVWNADSVEFESLERRVVRIIQIEPNSTLGHYLLAHLFVRKFSDDPTDLSLLRQASELAQQTIDLNRKLDFGYVVVSEILDLMGQQQNALKVLDSCPTSEGARTWRWYYMSAKLQSENLSLNDIERLLDKAMTVDNSQHEIIAPYVVALLQSEFDGDELLAKLLTWQEKHPNNMFALSIASFFSGAGEYQKARKLYREMYRSDPSQKEAQLNDAILVYRDLKQVGVAQNILIQLLKSDDGRLTDRSKSIAQYYLGNTYLSERNWEMAGKAYLRAISGLKDYESMLYLIMDEYNKKNSTDQLLYVLDELTSVIPGSALIFAVRGQVLSDKLSRHVLALDSYQKALILDPNRSEFHIGMGLVYYRMKNMIEALNQFNLAAEIDPTDAIAKYNEACILAILGRKEKALVSLEEAIDLDPNLQRTAEKDKDLETIRTDKRFSEIVLNKNTKTVQRNDGETEEDAVLDGH